jgi:5'-3' exonuclease
MKIHLVDGTYELFRSFYGPPGRTSPDGREVGASVYLLRNLLTLITQDEATHIAVAFDHEIRSFRNDLYAGYKTGDDIDPLLLGQFELAEELVSALGFVIWPMIEFEADDAIAAAAVNYSKDKRVDQVLICTPDKDLSQLVGGKIVVWDRRREIVYDEAGVVEKYGVKPASIPDYLALVGDAADGIPGIEAWGAKSVATVLSRFGDIESIDEDTSDWGITPGRAKRLKENLFGNMENALLYRELTRLRLDVPIKESVDDLEWQGARPELRGLLTDLGAEKMIESIPKWT